MRRSDAREVVYKIIFSELFNNEIDNDLKKELFEEAKLKKEDIDFADLLLNTIRTNKNELLSIIGRLSKGYTVDRLYSTDKCVLLISICEMTYFKDIPYIVSISEGMELVRKYSPEDSPNFVNGILAQYKKEIESKNDNT